VTDLSPSPPPASATGEILFGRKISLICYNVQSSGGAPIGASIQGPSPETATPQDGLDLSEMHVAFSVWAPDSGTPKTAIIRVFNLSDGSTGADGKPTKNTAGQIAGEFSRVVLQAGYVNGPFGVIFDGTIKQVRRGRLNATDKFVEIFAADGDIGINFAVVGANGDGTLAAGSTPQQRAAKLAAAVSAYGIQFDPTTLPATGGILPRGKVQFGMYRDQMRQLTTDQNFTWRVENGKVVVVPFGSYLPGEVVVLTSRSGLLLVPEATEDGVKIEALLNPKIRVGGRVQIDNKGLNTTKVKEQGFPAYSSISYFANEGNDGIYRVLVSEFVGDTRGTDWDSRLICLAIDSSAPAASSVKMFG
jgi:hypothetical protein